MRMVRVQRAPLDSTGPIVLVGATASTGLLVMRVRQGRGTAFAVALGMPAQRARHRVKVASRRRARGTGSAALLPESARVTLVSPNALATSRAPIQHVTTTELAMGAPTETALAAALTGTCGQRMAATLRVIAQTAEPAFVQTFSASA
jgi:hypothetical protein